MPRANQNDSDRGGGISWRINWLSVALLIPLVVTLSLLLFPFLAPDVPAMHYWWMGLLAVSGIVIGILIRFGALVAGLRMAGVKSAVIMLRLYGPSLHTRSIEMRARSDWSTVAVHQAATWLLALVAFLAFTNAPGEAPHLVVLTPALFLMLTHVGFALFYLLPAYPLDGGRILRLLLKWWRQDAFRATRISIGLAKVVAGLIGVAGGVVALIGLPFFGLWGVAVAFLLFMNAREAGRNL